MNSLKQILEKNLKTAKLKRRYNAEVVVLHWRDIVGEEIANHTRPGKTNNGILAVKAKNAVWAHHLMTLKEGIITKINSFAGEKVINDIKFQAGYLQNDQNEEDTIANDFETIKWQKEVLTQAELQEIEEITQKISDDKLRGKIKKLLVKDKTRNKAKAKNDWKNCRVCGVLCPPDFDLCTVCHIQLKTSNRGELRKLLMQAPWLTYEECKQYIDCHSTEYNTCKNELIETLVKEVEKDQNERVKAGFVVMLANGIKPEAVTEELIGTTLEKIRGKKNVFTPRR